jgi:hypothetical protein
MDEASDSHEPQATGRAWLSRVAATASSRRPGILSGVTSSLSAIPIAKRRQLLIVLAVFAALFAAVGIVAMTGNAPAMVRVFGMVALLVGVVDGLAAWGVAHSIGQDRAEERLNAAISETLAAHAAAGRLCDCGHDHDPDELHVSDDSRPCAHHNGSCAHDGSGEACAHDCETCLRLTRDGSRS